VHNIDLTGQEVPWQAIGQLDALEELSLWNTGLGGQIEAGALCRMRSLRVMAASQNALRGTVPECITELSLGWLWLEDNSVHGPISEYLSLGQWLKNVGSLNLGQNRWAPLLRVEKMALQAAAKPLGVAAAEPYWAGNRWDFGISYEWDWVLESDDLRQLTAEREVSHRYWDAGMVFNMAFWVSLPQFEFPNRDAVAQGFWVGSDCDLSVGGKGDPWVPLETRGMASSKSCSELGWPVRAQLALDDYPGTELVCGESDGNSDRGSSWPCTTSVGWDEARVLASASPSGPACARYSRCSSARGRQPAVGPTKAQSGPPTRAP
jgi:hypothetical protein